MTVELRPAKMRRGKKRRSLYRAEDLVKANKRDEMDREIVGEEVIVGVRPGAKPIGYIPPPDPTIREFQLPDGRVMKVRLAQGQIVNLEKEYKRQKKAGLI